MANFSTLFNPISVTITNYDEYQLLSFDEEQNNISISSGNSVSLSSIIVDATQTLSFDEEDQTLSISSGNTVSLSAIKGTGGITGDFLPLSGGDLTGPLTTTSTISSSQTISASGARVITGLPNDAVPVFYVTVLPQSAYDAIPTKDPNTLYFIS